MDIMNLIMYFFKREIADMVERSRRINSLQ